MGNGSIRLVCTLDHQPDEVSGIRFVPVKIGTRQVSVSERVTDASQVHRFLSIPGYERYEDSAGADLEAVDRAIAARVLAPAEQASSDRETIDGLVRNNQAMSAELAQLRRERDEARASVTPLEVQVSKLEARGAELLKQLEAAESGDPDKVTALTTELGTANALAEDRRQTLAAREAELLAAQQTIGTLEGEKTALAGQLESATEQLQAFVGVAEQHATLTEELRVAKERVTALEAQVQELQAAAAAGGKRSK